MQAPRIQFSPLLALMAGVFVCLLASGAQAHVRQKEAAAADSPLVKVNHQAFKDLLHKALIKVQGQLNPSGNLDVGLTNLSFEVLRRVSASRFARDRNAFFHAASVAGRGFREEAIHRHLKSSPEDKRINITFYRRRETFAALLSRYLSAY